MTDEMEFMRQETERVSNCIERIFPTHKIKVGMFEYKIATIQDYLVVISNGEIVFKRYCFTIDNLIKTDNVFIIMCYDYSTFQINLKEN